MSFEWFRRLTRPSPVPSNPLAGKPLRYLIGADDPGEGADDAVTEVPFIRRPVKRGISIAYCNMFDEENSGKLGPYLHDSDTATEYKEGQIDPRGKGWQQNLMNQFTLRRAQGFQYIELDNPDAYDIKDVIGAIELAAKYGLKVIAKNPGLVSGFVDYVEHPNIYGIIVEKGAGDPHVMDELRKSAGKPDLPTWFVSFGDGAKWADNAAIIIRSNRYRNMGVTWSRHGEYITSEDILRPQP